MTKTEQAGIILSRTCGEAICFSVFELPMEVPAIRINVDDFDEAYRMLTEGGYKPTHEGAFMENEHSKSVALVGPIGFTIYLVQHKK